MSYKTHLEHRQQMEQLLAQRAEDLLRARAAKVGVPPMRLLNQIVPVQATRPNPGEAEKNHVVKTLLQRLKERDDAA